MKTVTVAASRHQASREFVHDHDLAILDHVIDIALEEEVGLESLVNVVHPVHVLGFEEIADRQKLLGLLDPFFGQVYRSRLLVDLKVKITPQLGNDPVDLVVLVGGFLGWA